MINKSCLLSGFNLVLENIDFFLNESGITLVMEKKEAQIGEKDLSRICQKTSPSV